MLRTSVKGMLGGSAAFTVSALGLCALAKRGMLCSVVPPATAGNMAGN
jgi:hypothetical protein